MNFTRTAPEQYDTLDGVAEPVEHGLLVGHREQADALAAAHRAGRLHHALLLTGPAGIGKATLAFRLAYHLFKYPRPDEAPAHLADPDPSDQTFRALAQGAHPSALHLTRPANDRAKGFKTVITVDEVRRVGRFLSMTAHDGGWRVVIVDPVDDLNTAAANALLKNLEEPPARTVFLLVAHQPARLLPTIRSRCMKIALEPLPDAELLAVLDGLGVSLPGDEAARGDLLRRAAGSVRSAILLLEYGGLEIASAMGEVLAARRFDVAAATRIADAVTGRDRDQQFALFVGNMQELLAEAATRRGTAGQGDAADRLAVASMEFGQATAETLALNLDRRYHVTSSLMKAHRALAD